jgi:hypothetical protein
MLWTRKAGVLLTLEDTVEFFNLIDGTKLTPQEKQDLVAFLRALCSRRRCAPRRRFVSTLNPVDQGGFIAPLR